MTMRSSFKALLAGTALWAVAAMPVYGQVSKRPTDDSSDEAGLWYAVDKIEEKVKRSGLRMTDPVLIKYAQDVTCKVTGDDCSNIRLYIVNAPYFNASMYPNGMMILNSGLLLRAENEAQLSCVIGHEYGHFKNEHTLQQWRRAKTIANLSIVLNIAGAAAGAGRETSLGTQLASLMAQLSYSRAHEREADDIGFSTSAAAGYDSSQCAAVWENVIGEIESSTFKRVRRRAKGGGSFSSHPVPRERQETLANLAVQTPGGTYTGEAEHKAATSQYFDYWLSTELLAQDYDRHIYLFEELKARGRDSASLDFYLGEAYRRRKGEGDRERAVQAWKDSAAQAGAPAQVYRSLGEHYRRQKQTAEALQAYQTYLQRDPNAEDKALIQAYIERLKTP